MPYAAGLKTLDIAFDRDVVTLKVGGLEWVQELRKCPSLNHVSLTGFMYPNDKGRVQEAFQQLASKDFVVNLSAFKEIVAEPPKLPRMGGRQRLSGVVLMQKCHASEGPEFQQCWIASHSQSGGRPSKKAREE